MSDPEIRSRIILKDCTKPSYGVILKIGIAFDCNNGLLAESNQNRKGRFRPLHRAIERVALHGYAAGPCGSTGATRRGAGLVPWSRRRRGRCALPQWCRPDRWHRSAAPLAAHPRSMVPHGEGASQDFLPIRPIGPIWLDPASQAHGLTGLMPRVPGYADQKPNVTIQYPACAQSDVLCAAKGDACGAWWPRRSSPVP